MMNSSNGEIFKSKGNSCAKCDKRLMGSLVLSTKCGKSIHGRCKKIKGVTSTVAKGFFVKGVLRQ